MRLPFSESQFLDVFAAYNAVLWPAAVILWLATAALVVAWITGHQRASKLLSLLLAIHWAWAGIVHHFIFFSRINPAARFFAVLFVLQALAFVWFGLLRPTLSFSFLPSLRQLVGVGFVAYSLAYPFLCHVLGLRYPAMPTFGVPCPTTLLTVGLLLSASPLAPRALLIIPFLWCLIAGSAALMLGVSADFALFVAAALLLALAFAPRRATQVHAA